MSQPPPLPPRPASREPPASGGASSARASATRPAAMMRDGGTPIAVCVRVRPLNEYEIQHGGGGDNVWTVREESNALAFRPAADAPGTTYSFEKARCPPHLRIRGYLRTSVRVCVFSPFADTPTRAPVGFGILSGPTRQTGPVGAHTERHIGGVC